MRSYFKPPDHFQAFWHNFACNIYSFSWWFWRCIRNIPGAKVQSFLQAIQVVSIILCLYGNNVIGEKKKNCRLSYVIHNILWTYTKRCTQDVIIVIFPMWLARPSVAWCFVCSVYRHVFFPNCRCCYFQTPSVLHCMTATASVQSPKFLRNFYPQTIDDLHISHNASGMGANIRVLLIRSSSSHS